MLDGDLVDGVENREHTLEIVALGARRQRVGEDVRVKLKRDPVQFLRAERFAQGGLLISEQ